MVAPGKTHNIIGTKLWNMQYGGWLLFVPVESCGVSPFRGTFDFCSCAADRLRAGRGHVRRGQTASRRHQLCEVTVM